ncbi:MAG: Gingipain R, partial [Bacteroidetes bacterium]|nr:Gingipain R [Bacteroidota bacterium]
LVVFNLVTLTVFAGNIIIKENGSNGVSVKENSYNLMGVSSSVSEISFQTVKTTAGNFTLLTINGYTYSIVNGNPKLPVIKKLIEVPVDASFDVNILTGEFVEINLADYGIVDPVIPAQPPLSKGIDNPEDVEFVYNQAAYQVDVFNGQELVTVTELGIMRGVRIARLEIAPVQYNPVQNKIKVYTNVDVKINFTGGDIPATLENKEQLFSPYYEGIFSELINYKSLTGKELIEDEPVTYVIVSDVMFQAALQPFIEWKTKKGFYVIEAYTNDPLVGNTTTSITNYLENLYDNPPAGFNAPTFVLLVGDVAQIPAYTGTSGGHVTDLYYFEYTGDIFPEVIYGRFSATNLAQLQPQIDKTLEYEQYTFPDPAFLDEVVMVAGSDAGHITWSNGQINYGTTYYFNEAHGIYSHTYLQPEPGGGNYSQNIRQNVSDGVSFANYTAHCSASGWADPSFIISHIPSLTNDHKYCLMVGNCCSSVEFQTTCFGEEIVRAANKGALGYIGGSNSTYWDEDYYWGVGAKAVVLNPVYDGTHLGAYDRTFHDHGEPLSEWYATQGQMIPAGNLAVSQSTSSMEVYYWEIYHLMGDPSVMIYYSQAPDVFANYQALMPLAATTFTVNTDAHSYVAISKDGTLHGCGMADATGLAEVTMFDPIVVPGTADVVITGQNLKPFIGTVNVASPAGAYVLLDDFEIDDSNGNNNGLVDFDETIHLNVTLENLGSQTATSVVATLSSTDDYITLNIFTHNWPNIPAGSTSTQNDAFSFTV